MMNAQEQKTDLHLRVLQKWRLDIEGAEWLNTKYAALLVRAKEAHSEDESLHMRLVHVGY